MNSSSSLFETWPHDPTAPMWRIVEPPLPVTVELGTAIVTRPAHFGVNKVRLGIRKGGLRLTDTTPGLLRAWARVASLHLSTVIGHADGSRSSTWRAPPV